MQYKLPVFSSNDSIYTEPYLSAKYYRNKIFDENDTKDRNANESEGLAQTNERTFGPCVPKIAFCDATVGDWGFIIYMYI